MKHLVEWEVAAKLGNTVARLEVEKRKLVVDRQEDAPSRGAELNHETAR